VFQRAKGAKSGHAWACRPAGWLIDRLRFSDLHGCCLLKSIQNFSRQQTADQEINVQLMSEGPSRNSTMLRWVIGL
jgi:hypothetical protein